MGLETNVDKVSDLNDAWPLGTDPKSQGDDHIRFCKKAMLSGDFSGIDLQADAITAFGALTGDTVSDSIGDLRAAIEQALSQANNPNLIINGDMSVWQRGTSFVPPTPQYTSDRWYTASATTTVNRQAWSGANATYCADVLNTASGGKIAQPVELFSTGNAKPFVQGSTWTVSFEATSATTDTAGIFVDFADNSAGANSVTVALNNNIGTITSTPTVFSHTFTIGVDPVGTTKTLRVFVGGETINQSVYITNVKLERGSVATPFIPDDPATNLAKCQRYYWVMDTYAAYYATQGTSTQKFCSISYPVTMRANPTVNAVYVNGNFIQNTVGKTQWNGYINSGTEDTVTHFIDNATFDAEL